MVEGSGFKVEGLGLRICGTDPEMSKLSGLSILQSASLGISRQTTCLMQIFNE